MGIFRKPPRSIVRPPLLPVQPFIPSAPPGGTTFTQSFSGSVICDGTITNQVQKSLVGSSTLVGALSKQGSKALVGSTTTSGSLAKQGQKSFTGSVTPSGTFTAIKTVLRSFTGSVTLAGSLVKQVQKSVSGSTTTSGSLAKSGSKPLTGSLAPTGALAKQARKLFSGSTTTSGLLTMIKVAVKNFTGSVTLAGTFTKQVAKSLAGSVAPSGALSRKVAKALTGAANLAGALAKKVNKSFTGSTALSGVLSSTKVVVRSFAGSVALSGAFSKQASKIFTGSTTLSGSLAKFVRKAFTGSATLVGNLIRSGGAVVTWIRTRVRTIPRGIQGANLVPTAAEVASGNLAWRDFWANWNWPRIKFQVDLIAAAGWNTVRVIGDCQGVTAGTFSLDTYLARYKQLVEYCRYKGLWFYPCTASENDVYDLGVSAFVLTPAQVAAVVGPVAGLLSRYDHVIGVDGIQELTGVESAAGTGVLQTYVDAVRAAVKASAPRLSLAFSSSVVSTGLAATGIAAYGHNAADHCDHHLYGVYADPPDVIAAETLAGSKPMIAGECGWRAGDTANIPIQFAGYKRVVSRPKWRGSLVWAVLPQDVPLLGSNDWGVFDDAGAPRQVLLDAFNSFPNYGQRAYPLRWQTRAPTGA